MLCVAALVALAPAPGAAQTARPERPDRSLFAGDAPDAKQLLALTLSAGGGVDDSRLGGAEPLATSVTPWLDRQAGFAQLSGSLKYRGERRTFAFVASAGASRSRQEGLDDDVSIFNGSAAADIHVSRYTAIRVNQTLSHRPYFMPAFMSGVSRSEPFAAEPSGLESRVTRFRTTSAAGDVELTRSLGRADVLTATYGYRLNEAGDERFDLRTTVGGVKWTRQIGGGSSIRAGYQRQGGHYGSGEDRVPVVLHGLDTGVDYRRRLSFSRRTTVGLGTGILVAESYGSRNAHLTAAAQLAQEIGRTWNAVLFYERSAGLVESLRNAVPFDALRVSVSGLVNRRVTLRFAGSYLDGHSRERRDALNIYRTAGGATVALSANAALAADYSFDQYEFTQTARLPEGLSRALDRHAVRVRLTTWLPLFQRNRRPDAPR